GVALLGSATATFGGNVATGDLSLWVVLRPTGVDPPFDLLAVTADPSEGEAFTQAGNDLVEPVPMPLPMREALEAFVRQHHVDTAFVKRRRDEADPEALARRAPPRRRDPEEGGGGFSAALVGPQVGVRAAAARAGAGSRGGQTPGPAGPRGRDAGDDGDARRAPRSHEAPADRVH